MKKIATVIGCLIVVLIGFKLTYFQSTTIFGYDGVVITDEKVTNNLLNIPEKTTGTLVKAMNVHASDMLYAKNGNLFYGENKKTKLLKGYPTFINESKGLLTLDNSAILLDDKFKEYDTYPNLILTNGALFQGTVNQRLDDHDYYFMKLSNGLFINSKEMIVKTQLHDYHFKINSIHNFTEKSIQSYIPDGDAFKYQVIHDVDFASTIEIGDIKIKYKDFLEHLGFYSENKGNSAKKDEKKSEKQDELKDVETVEPLREQVQNKATEKEQLIKHDNIDGQKQDEHQKTPEEVTEPYVKPQVAVSEFLGVPYGFKSKLTVQDPDNHLRSSIVFQIYEGDDLILRKSYRSSSDLLFDGLKPNQEYHISGEYVYSNADGKQESDKFLDLKVKTGGISELDKIALSGEAHHILSDSFTMDNFKITSDLKDAALIYLQTIEITANNVQFNIKNEDLIKMKKGEALSIQFPKLLSSNADYKITVHLYDRYKNEIPSSFHELNIHTPKKSPDVIYSFITKNIDEFDIKYKMTDDDHVDPQQGVFQLYKITEDGKTGDMVGEVKEKDTKDNLISFKNFDYSDAYILRYSATVDLHDGKGKQEHYVIKDFKITNASLSQLGAIYMTTNVPTYDESDSFPTSETYVPSKASYPYKIKNDTSYNASYDVNINQTSNKLLELMDSMKMDLYTKDEKGNKTIVRTNTYKKGDEIFDKVKNKASFTKYYDNLTPNTRYFIDFTGYYKSGTIGISSTINNFKTWKQMPTIGISNVLMTQDTFYGLVSVDDPDDVTNTKRVMVVLQELDEKAKNPLTDGKTIDVAIVNIDTPRQKIRLKGMQQGRQYVLNYYMSDALWSDNSVPVKEAKVLLQSQVFKADDEIYGSLDVQSVEDNKVDSKQLDVSLATTFSDKANIGTGTYYIDLYKEGKKIDSLSYHNTYQQGADLQNTKVMTLPREDVEYTAKLYVYSQLYGDRIELSETSFNTKFKIRLINTCDLLYAVNGSNSPYKVTKDLDCSASPKTINSFNGEIDFDGHELKYAYRNNSYLFNTLQKNAVIKNLHYTVLANNQVSQKGIANTNYGTISNLSLETVGSNTINEPAWGRSELAFSNKGTIDTFSITMTDPDKNIQLGETNISMGVVNNSGIIRNGYVSNGLLSVRLGSLSYNDRVAGAIAATNQNGGIIENIYALNDFQGNGTYNNTGNAANVVGINKGTVRNIYATQPPVNNISAQGAAVGVNYGEASNIYYIDNRLHNNDANQRITYSQIHSSEFQTKVLNAGNNKKFDIDRFIDNGYYPQLMFDNEHMPKQPFRALPKVNDKAKIAFIDSTVKVEPKDPTSFDYYGVVTLLLKNPYHYKITSVTFNNLTAQVLKQTDDKKNENSSIDVKVNVPKDGQFVDQHNLMSIVYQDTLGNPVTINYPASDARYIINISFYNKVSSIDEWQRINTYPNQNFEVTQDIDFLNINAAALIDVSVSGKIKGNHHTLSNINMNGYGYVISKLNGGTLQNLNFNQVQINNPNSQRGGLIATANSGSLIDGVHVDDLTLTGGNLLGGIVGTLQSIVQNSSVSNASLTMNQANSSGLGGIAGAFDGIGASIQNSFVQDVNLTTSASATTSRSVGGIVGYTQTGSVSNVYAVVNIKAPNTSYVGGVIGNLPRNYKTDVQGIYAKANIQGVDFVGGLIGNDAQNGTEVAQNTYISDTIHGFFTGDIKATGTSGYVLGGFSKQKPIAMYVNQSSLLNNVASSDSSIVLNDNDFKMEKTYTDTIGLNSAYVMNKDTSTAILPKLVDMDTHTMLPYQKDNILEEKDIYLKSAAIKQDSKFATEGTLTLKINNENNYPIERIAFKDQMMTTQGEATSTYDKATHITTYIIKVKPNYFINSYMLDTLDYTCDGQSKSIDASTQINSKFYRKISSVQDWPIDMEMHNYVENYHFVNDIDFAGKEISDINVFRRYFNNNINDVEGEGHTIKNLVITAPLIPDKDFLIKSVKGTLQNLNLENVTFVYNYQGISDGQNQVKAGIFGTNNGIIRNAVVKNLKLNYANVTSNLSNMAMGIVAVNLGKLDNISLDNVRIRGDGSTSNLSNIGLLTGIGNANASFTNIKIKNSIMDVNGISAGGMIGRYDSGSRTISNVSVLNTEISNASNETGGMIGRLNLSNSSLSNIVINGVTLNGKGNVGGVFGNSPKLNISNLSADNVTVSGINGIGGIGGNLNGNDTTYVSNSKLSTINITSIGDSAGGILGSGTQKLVISNVKGTGFKITSGENFAGGFVGNQKNDSTIQNVDMNDINVAGGYSLGGFFGQILGQSFYATDSYIRDLGINSSQEQVGGMAGRLNGVTDIKIKNSGIQANTILAKGYTGGLLGNVDAKNSNVTIINSYVTGVNTRAMIHSIRNTGGLIGNTLVSNTTTIQDSYVYASVKSDGSTAGMAIGTAGSVSVNGFMSIGDVSAGTNGAGGVLGQVLAGPTNISMKHALILADVTMTNGNTSVADQLIGRKYDTNLIYDKLYIYLGNKINDIAIKGNYESRYDSIDGVHLIDYTNLTDPTLYISNDGLELSNNWNSGKVDQGYAPSLNGVNYQFDIRMSVNLIRASFRSAPFVYPAILPEVKYYTSDVDKVNIEFNSQAEGLQFTIRQHGKDILKHDIHHPIYTLQYDFKAPFDIIVSNGRKQASYTIDPNKISRDAYVNNEGYTYLTNEGITTQNNHLKGTFLNLYKGKALDDKGDIYNAITLVKEHSIKDNLTLQIQPTPLYTFEADGVHVQTFDGFTYLENQVQREGDIYMKNNKLSYIDPSVAAVKDSVIIDDLNGKHIETILSKDGKLLDLGDKLPLPSGFDNNNIKYITDNLHHDNGIVIIVYKDGAKLIYNYKTNTVLHNENAPIEKIGFINYLKSNLSLKMFDRTSTLSDKYEDIQHTMRALTADPALDESLQSTRQETLSKNDDNNKKENKNQHLSNEAVLKAEDSVKADQQYEQKDVRKADNTTFTKNDKEVKQKSQANKQALTHTTPQLLAVYKPKKKDYVIYDSKDILDPDMKDIKSVEELAQKNPDLKNLLVSKAVSTKKVSIQNKVVVLFIGILISGCLFYILKQQKVIKAK